MKLNREALAVELPAKITAEWLESLGACANEVELFRNEWPDGAPVSPATVRRAAKLNIAWLAEKILVAQAREVYGEAVAQAREVYGETVAQAWKVYWKAVSQALIKILWK